VLIQQCSETMNFPLIHYLTFVHLYYETSTIQADCKDTYASCLTSLFPTGTTPTVTFCLVFITVAHHTQFYFPGWHYLNWQQGVGNLSGNGTYISLTSPDRKHLTIVVSTLVSISVYKKDVENSVKECLSNNYSHSDDRYF